jgi:hypothetical protein
MTVRSKSTVKMICAKSGIANMELAKEAQKIVELSDDPSVPPEQKEIVKAELDNAIDALEARVTTRRLRDAAKRAGLEAK